MLTDAQTKAKNATMVVYKQHYGPGYAVERPKTKKKKRSYDAVFPSGFDDGKGAQRLMQTYVEETLSETQPKQHVKIDWDTITDDFKSCSFLEQVNHLEMKNIPLLSQIARQKALLPTHTTEKKKRLIDLAHRLKHDDSNLVRIRLDNEGIDDVTIVHLTLALPKNTHLQHLMLHNNSITDEGVNLLCLALRWHPQFHCLWIGANRITDIGARHFSILLHRNPRIKELNISNRWPVNYWQSTEIDLHPHITYIGADIISQQLAKGCGLTRLSLADQRIRDDGAINLFNVLSHCELRSLNISGNELSDRCCSTLGAILSTNPLLQMLSIARNDIGDVGAKAIAKGLARNHELQGLDLSDNIIDNEGMEAFYQCVSHYNQTIKTLVTINNKSEDPRAENVAAARNRNCNVFRYGNRPTSSDEDFFTDGHLHAQSRANARNHMRDLFVSAEERDFFYQGGGSGGGHESQEFGHAVNVDQHPYNDYSRLDAMSRSGIRSRGVSRSSLSASQRGGVGSTDARRDSLISPWRRPSVDLNLEATHVGVLGKSILSSSFRNFFDEQPRGTTPEHQQRTGTGGSARRGSTMRSRGNSMMAFGDAFKQFSATSTETEDHHAIEAAVKRVTNTVHGSPTPSVASRSSTPGGNKRRSFIATLQSLSAAPSESSTTLASFLAIDKKKSISEGPKKFRMSFQGGADTGRQSTPNFPKEEVHSLNHDKKSADLGKTVGIPDIKNIGILPVRTSITSDKDSAQHFLYLRVSTTADDIDDRPTSILKIGRDRENEIKKLKASRQTAQYKADKKYLLETVSKVVVHKAAEKKVPDKFWDDWRIKNRLQYIDGIDNADGCTSTLLEVPNGGRAKRKNKTKRNKKHAPLPPIQHIEEKVLTSYDLVMSKQDPKLAYQRHLVAKKVNATPGEILAARRKEIYIQKMKRKQAAADGIILEDNNNINSSDNETNVTFLAIENTNNLNVDV